MVAPEFNLRTPDGQMVTMEDFESYRGLLVTFTCNHCPYAQAAWPEFVKLYTDFGDDIAFVAINSNDADEYPEDGIEGMKQLIQQYGVDFPYLRDEDQTVAASYNAQCTPDTYLFIREGHEFTLYYHGRVTDNWQHPDQAASHDLEDAIQNLLDGEEPVEIQYPSMGCSIKWKE